MKCGSDVSAKMWFKLKFSSNLKSHLKLDMGNFNFCGCSEEALAAERTSELDCSKNLLTFGALEQTESFEEPTIQKTANQ